MLAVPSILVYLAFEADCRSASYDPSTHCVCIAAGDASNSPRRFDIKNKFAEVGREFERRLP